MDKLLSLVEEGLTIFDLSHPMLTGSPAHPATAGFRMHMALRHGDRVAPDGKSSAHELIVTGSHVGTHIDALGHVSQDGRLYGGIDAIANQKGGRFDKHGVDEIGVSVTRGILLDVAAAKGLEKLPGDTPISIADLEQAADFGNVELRSGDSVMIRIGWAPNYLDQTKFLGLESGVPGPTVEAAEWLAAKGIFCTGSETLSWEYLKPKVGTDGGVPCHRVLLVEHGIPILEVMNLDPLSEAKVYEFSFVLAPMNWVGASGAPVRPLALISKN